MGNYVEKNLIKHEKIIKKAELSFIPLIINFIKLALTVALVCCFYSFLEKGKELLGVSWMELISDLSLFTIIWFVIGVMISVFVISHDLKSIFRYFNMELAITDKRVIGKVGIISTSSMDVPLDKIHSVTVSNGLFGKLFNYGTIVVSMSTFETFRYKFIKSPDDYKVTLMQEIDRYKREEKAMKIAEENDG